ncbi:hypothetical protein K470DRAFT_257193 [Piedraia hortae CBS 480.64]|uniref:Uncharacterized protein n=1 Tax=Piedraia hortae CBS 480.64 TaxID=1314780 RepID=A0A6A7C117_9PEZI|nr:hypothetical protein K470DRAFT_257193 [Piedraia hortae CBS 480.64]
MQPYLEISTTARCWGEAVCARDDLRRLSAQGIRYTDAPCLLFIATLLPRAVWTALLDQFIVSSLPSRLQFGLSSSLGLIEPFLLSTVTRVQSNIPFKPISSDRGSIRRLSNHPIKQKQLSRCSMLNAAYLLCGLEPGDFITWLTFADDRNTGCERRLLSNNSFVALRETESRLLLLARLHGVFQRPSYALGGGRF